MKRFYAGSDATAPEAVECEQVGYPHVDVKGRVQYDNSHYDTETEAWGHLLANADAAVIFFGVRVAQAKGDLRRIEADAASAAETFALIRQGQESWLLEQPRATEPAK